MARKRGLFFLGLLLALLVFFAVSASADGLISGLNVYEIRAASAVAAWNCTVKDEQEYTIAYHVEGIDRDTVRVTTNTDYRLKYLCPATTYVLTVSTVNGGSSTITFTTPYAVEYSRYGFLPLKTGLCRTTAGKKDYAGISSLSSGTLPGEVYDYDFYFMFQFTLAKSDGDKQLPCVLLLTLPNGDIYAMDAEYWYGEDSATITEYLCMTDTLKTVMADYDGFPTGDYTLTLYIKGEYAAEMTVAMKGTEETNGE